MKKGVLFGLATLVSGAAIAQNTVVINQQGSPQAGVSVQPNTGSTSMVSRGDSSATNQVVISQTGSGNRAVINQSSLSDATTDSGNSVVTSMSENSELIINQTGKGNTVHVFQSGWVGDDRPKKAKRKRSDS